MTTGSLTDGWTIYRPVNGPQANPVAIELTNVLDALDVPIIVVRSDFTIGCFNHAAAAAFDLDPSYVGRSPNEISLLTDFPNLQEWCAQAITAATPSRHDLHDEQRSFVLRISSHARSDGTIAGAVLTLTNVTAFHASLDQAIHEREFAKAILNTVAEPLLVLSSDLRVETANRAFYAMFQVSREQAQNVLLSEFGNRAFNVPGLPAQLQETLAGNRDFQPFEINHEFPVIGRRTVMLNARQLSLQDQSRRAILLGLQDVTERTCAEQILRDSEHRLREVVEALPVAVYMTDAQGRITLFNNATCQLSGRVPQLGSDSWCVALKLYWPDGRSMPHDECPMALALKSARPVWGAEAIAERPDGTRVWLEAHATPLHDEAGKLVGAVNMLVNITERKEADEDKQRLNSIVENSQDAIISKDLNGIIASWNKGAERMFGYTADEAVGKPVTMLIPLERHDEEPEILERIGRGERVGHYETVRMRKDGSLIDISLTVSPVKDASGKVIGASKVARDISERRKAEAHQELLAREISHRTKNLFAVAQAVVSRSFAGKQTVEEAESAVLGRLSSLAQTHVMLLDKQWEAADIREVVSAEMAPFAGRVEIDGPTVMLTGKAAQNVALAIHELATNAAKYGALSTAAGRVHINWSVNESAGSRTFVFRWQERGGPPVAEPKRKGFGSTVLERVMAEFFSEPRMEFAPSGVSYELIAPLDAIVGTGQHSA
ncbi:MAG: PAS domain S-box protein [Rhodospirillales bacterium]|nr:PAS domain S-box protein [Rhodospirillales bacterium]